MLENEQFKLASAIGSTCSSLDSTPNLLMAFSRLKYGDFEKARELFSRSVFRGFVSREIK